MNGAIAPRGTSYNSHARYQCLKSSKWLTRFQWNNESGTIYRWFWVQILKRNARLLQEWDTCLLSRSSHLTSSSPPHMCAHNSMIQHQSPQKSERFWVIQITLGRYHKKGMWRKKWVTTLTLETLASLPIIREKEQNSEDPQRKEVFQKGKFLSFLSEIWILRIMWCK